MPPFNSLRHALSRLLTSACGITMVALMLAGTASAFDTVILDPGHGAHDRGAAIGYVYEKHLALDTARRVEQLLKKAGLKVIMSRSRDVFIPLQDRSALGNSRHNAIFVSIHYNYNRGGSGAGAETYYHFSSSYMLAAYIQAYLVQRTGMINRGCQERRLSRYSCHHQKPGGARRMRLRQQLLRTRPHAHRRVSRQDRRRHRQGIIAFKKSK